jgi:Mycothiol maleylpyruvate isomerase N-terminal domain
MGAKSEALAQQFEAKAREAATTLEAINDADWRKVTAAEQWTVGVTAHHLAGAFEPVAGIVTALAAGKPLGAFTTAMLDSMNAQHARDHAQCTKAETLALHRKGAATAAAVVRGLGDDQLARQGTVFSDAPPMTVEQMITAALINHIDEHYGSIRRTIG